MTSHPAIAAFFDEACALYKDPVKVANFVQGELLRDAKTTGLTASFPVTPSQVAELLALIADKTISGKQGKEVYAAIIHGDKRPADVVKELGLVVLSDASAIEAIAKDLIAKNPKQADGYRSGKASLLGFFVGQIMKQTGGSASPAVVNDVLRGLLGDVAPEEPKPKAEPAPKPATVEASKAPAEAPEAPAPANAGQIGFDEFVKVDLRVGVVVAAVKVPKKDKLLDLLVDVGEAEPRRIVSGLALSFPPADLVGQHVVVVCNLAPRAFSKDLVSHGMLLASGPSDALALATLTKVLPAGTRVK